MHDDNQGLVEAFIPFMRSVAQCEKQLENLNFTWGMIEATAKMNCPAEAKTILPTMGATREGFGRLERQLIENLVQENIRKVVLEIGSKAQVAVDILIRNLYERTADVGFLATDEDIRDFIRQRKEAPDQETLEGEKARILRRLQEYRDKYTVYDEILVLDLNGRVIAHLDGASPVLFSQDPLLQQTLHTDGYVETFRASDLRPGLERALIYSQRIDDGDSGEPLGVLCLCFRFADETESIFRNLRRREDRSVMLLLDAQGTVIASSDADHVPLGRRLEQVRDADYRIVDWGGREYLARTCPTRGYQGYVGPGWVGHVMVPVSSAFRTGLGQAAESLPAEVLEGVLAHADTFCPALADIARGAEGINLSLRRVVWNGQIMAADKRGDLLKLKSVLQQISETGDRTSDLFARSIADLYQTAISSSLQDVQFISRLMIDIMDRNLYERANDCRWWALTSALRRSMAAGRPGEAEAQAMAGILEYINSLYTVYSRLFVYDLSGTIVAASNLHGDSLNLVGKKVDAGWVQSVFYLPSTQHYCVSPFEKSWLYGGHPTYVYNAAIRHPDDPSKVVGGIGIVFDAAPQFSAMLADSLPPQAGAFAVFAERSGRIIASSDERFPAESLLEVEKLDKSLFSAANGEGRSRVVQLAGRTWIVGSTASFGYREFKNSGDYSNDVVALVFVPVGDGSAAAAPRERRPAVLEGCYGDLHARGGQSVELATFVVGDKVYGLPAAEVLEAVDPARLSPMSGSRRYLCGVISFQSGGGDSGTLVPVVDMRFLLNYPAKEVDNHSQIVVVRVRDGLMGLLVDDLYAVPEFDAERLEPIPEMIRQDAGYVQAIIKPRQPDREKILQVLDPERICGAAQRKPESAAGGEAPRPAVPLRAIGGPGGGR